MDQAHYHEPVMVTEVAGLLAPVPAGTIVDATFGGGGHSRALLEALPGIRVLAVDRDPDAAANAAGLGDRLKFVLGDFRRLEDLPEAAVHFRGHASVGAKQDAVLVLRHELGARPRLAA